MAQLDLKRLAHPIALSWLGGDSSWKDILEKIIKAEIPKEIDDETTFSSLVKEINHFVNEILMVYIEENMYDILSERELFNEQEWEGKSNIFQQAVKTFLIDQADNMASNILDEYSDDVQYSRNKNRYFGTSNDDFF